MTMHCMQTELSFYSFVDLLGVFGIYSEYTVITLIYQSCIEKCTDLSAGVMVMKRRA